MTLGSTLPKPKIDARPMGAHRLFMLTDDALFEACATRIAFTSRLGGVSAAPYDSLNLGAHVGDNLEAVLTNRRLVLEALDAASAELVVPNQVHGTEVLVVSQRDADALDDVRASAQAGADALVVEAPSTAALLNFADCMPVIMVAPSGRFAIAHAGWRGAVAGIVGKAMRQLVKLEAAACGDASESSLRKIAASCNVYIGPHIHAECFETGADVAQRFLDAFGSTAVPDERHVSLAAAARVDLERVGCDAERIVDAGVCTMCSADRYFSYRHAKGTCGRHAAVAVRLKG